MKKSQFAPVYLASAVLLALIAVACTTVVPDTGRKQVNFLKPSEEAALGLSEFQKLKSEKRISNNATYNAQLQRVGSRLSKVMPVPNAEWEFVVFEDSSPNAFALPGGKVGVHTGLFQISQNEAGLAAVVGHEVAHVVARHSGERMSQGIVSAGAVAGAAAIINNRGGNPAAASVLLGGGALILNRKFSREQELEADKLGALYMARAGYDPRESVELWKRFAAWRTQSGQGSQGMAFMRTHPVDEVRIARLQEFLPRALSEYNP